MKNIPSTIIFPYRKVISVAGLLFFPVLFIFSVGVTMTPGSRIEKITFYSPSLGIQKSFNIYLPEGYDHSEKRYPVLYLFRGHEDEWKDRGNIKEIADDLVSRRLMGEMIIVLPGLTFGKNFVGFPVDLINPDLSEEKTEIGSGRFEDFIVKDLIPYVDQHYRTIAARSARAADGYSAGAFSSIFLALRHPDLFCSVGSYDGNLGYLDFNDPNKPGVLDDSIYMYIPVFDPYFGNPRDMGYMKQCNPSNIIKSAPPEQLDMIKEIIFFMQSACETAKSAYIEGSYYPRVKQFVELLAERGIHNYLGDDLVMSPNADHNWADAMVYIKSTLPLHWDMFANNHKAK